MKTGPNPGQIIPLDKTEYILGRDLNNDIVVNDSEVSRKHTKIYVFGQGFVVEDMGSTNGTFVNGQRINGPHTLIPGELIALGDQTTFLFEVAEVDEDATRVATPPIQQAPQPQYQVPMQQPPIQQAPPVRAQSSPNYAGSVPSAPSYVEPPKKKRRVGLIILIVILLMLCACVVFWVVVDQLNWYCDLFPGIMNAIFGSGTCPSF
jgi:predicted component of type VI protein secretion system